MTSLFVITVEHFQGSLIDCLKLKKCNEKKWPAILSRYSKVVSNCGSHWYVGWADWWVPLLYFCFHWVFIHWLNIQIHIDSMELRQQTEWCCHWCDLLTLSCLTLCSLVIDHVVIASYCIYYCVYGLIVTDSIMLWSYFMAFFHSHPALTYTFFCVFFLLYFYIFMTFEEIYKVVVVDLQHCTGEGRYLIMSSWILEGILKRIFSNVRVFKIAYICIEHTYFSWTGQKDLNKNVLMVLFEFNNFEDQIPPTCFVCLKKSTSPSRIELHYHQ